MTFVGIKYFLISAYLTEENLTWIIKECNILKKKLVWILTFSLVFTFFKTFMLHLCVNDIQLLVLIEFLKLALKSYFYKPDRVLKSFF